MSSNPPVATPEAPWYRQAWPVFVFSLPAIAVVASFISLGYALAYRDETVGGDYYKEGLAINHSLALEDKAWQGRIAATVSIDEQGLLTARLEGDPEALDATRQAVLHITHPQESSLDQIVPLAPGPGHTLVGHITALDPRIRWQFALETRDWLVKGSAVLSAGASAKLLAPAPIE
jgi:hypothetical protein